MGSDGEGAATASKAKAPAKRAPASKAAKADAPARGRGRGAAAGRGRGRGAAAKGSAGSSGGAPINLSDDDDDDGFGAGADTVSPHHLLPRRDPTHPCHPDLQHPLARLVYRSRRLPVASGRALRRGRPPRSAAGEATSLPPPTYPALSATRASLAPAPAGAKTPTTTQVTRTMRGTCSRLVLRRAARPSRSRASVA
jgi:hypothetical protein